MRHTVMCLKKIVMQGMALGACVYMRVHVCVCAHQEGEGGVGPAGWPLVVCSRLDGLRCPVRSRLFPQAGSRMHQ